VACLNFKKSPVKEPDLYAHVCSPIFWEGKGNGKHETEKFLKRKFIDFSTPH
jgi:hypothetical protein